MVLVLGLSAPVQGLTLDAQHFLYPLDYEYLLFNGLEDLPHISAAKGIAEDCDLNFVSLRTAQDVRKEILCRIYKKVNIDSWDHVRTQAFWGRDAKVLYFGERHLDVHIQVEFSKILAELRRDGFTTLALEMFPKSVQGDLDDYLADRISLSQILKILSQHWSYRQSGYSKILQEAKLNGFKIIGIDQREGVQNKDLLQNILERDDIMASTLGQYMLDHKNEKLVVYVGALHAPLKYSDTGMVKTQAEKLSKILGDHNLNVEIESYIFKNGTKNTLFKNIMAAKALGTAKNTAFLGRSALKYADGMFFIHPQSTPVIQVAEAQTR